MSTKRQALLKRLSSLPEEVLDEVASSVDDIEALRGEGVYRVSHEERVAVRRGVDAARAGDIVPDDELDAFVRRHGV
jgi:hypothetical protein